MKLNPTPRLLVASFFLSSTLYAGSEVSLDTATITDSGSLKLEYNFTNAGDGSTCIALVKMERIRDSIDYDHPERVAAIRISNLVWDESHSNLSDYEEALIDTPRKGKNNPLLSKSGAGVLYNCTDLDAGSSSTAGENAYHGMFSKRKKGYLQDNPIHQIELSENILAAYSWQATDVPSFTSFNTDNFDYTATDDSGDYVVIDESMVITTAILRRNNGNTKEFYHFESWVDLETGEVTNLPIGLDMETWFYPGYDTNYAQPLPALITFNEQNQPGCLAQLNNSNKYECLWPVDGDIKNAFPLSVGDISNTDDFRVLSCGEAEEDGIELSSGIYDVVSLETQDGVTGYHSSSHWCLRTDKTYRSWHNLVSTTGQGWIASKDGMGDWWCMRDGDRVCKNSLIETVTIPEDHNLGSKMSVLASPMADTSLTSCRFNDNTIGPCSTNDNNAFDSTVTFDTLKKAFFIDAANLLDSEEPTQ